MVGRPAIPDENYMGRFAARLLRPATANPETGCWEWPSPRLNRDGYGQIKFIRRFMTAQRASHVLFIGPIPDGAEVDHLCRNRACINPAHLEAVSRRENILRGNNQAALNARKTHCKRGHPLSGDNLVLVQTGKQRVARGCKTCRAIPRKKGRT